MSWVIPHKLKKIPHKLANVSLSAENQSFFKERCKTFTGTKFSEARLHFDTFELWIVGQVI